MAKKRVLGVVGMGHVGAHVAYALAGWGVLSRLLRRKSVLDKIYAGLGCAAADIFAVVYAGFLLVVYVIPVVYTIYLRWI